MARACGDRTKTLSIRLTPEKRAQLDSLRSRLPYAPTITTIIERGIDLAAAELERMAEKIERPER